MRNWLARALAGRYGIDHLNRFLCVTAMVALVVSMLMKPLLATVFWALAVLCLIWSYIRMFSRRIEKRQQENLRYMHYKYEITSRLRGLRTRMAQRRQYKLFKCPNCGITARVPRGKGKIRITCPKCGHDFEARS
ncbi:MAG: hypothetical protein VB086_12790 [Clostridiaceae bacterium]|nr:hypothetical protein [Clostridiaceae bacterium]